MLELDPVLNIPSPMPRNILFIPRLPIPDMPARPPDPVRLCCVPAAAAPPEEPIDGEALTKAGLEIAAAVAVVVLGGAGGRVLDGDENPSPLAAAAPVALGSAPAPARAPPDVPRPDPVRRRRRFRLFHPLEFAHRAEIRGGSAREERLERLRESLGWREHDFHQRLARAHLPRHQPRVRRGRGRSPRTFAQHR